MGYSLLFWNFQTLLLGRQAKLVQSPRFNLPDAFFGHAQILTDLFKRPRFLAVVQPEAANDNLLLSLVKP